MKGSYVGIICCAVRGNSDFLLRCSQRARDVKHLLRITQAFRSNLARRGYGLELIAVPFGVLVSAHAYALHIRPSSIAPAHPHNSTCLQHLQSVERSLQARRSLPRLPASLNTLKTCPRPPPPSLHPYFCHRSVCPYQGQQPLTLHFTD